MPSWRRNSWPPLGVMPSASTIGSRGSASLNLRITWAARSGIAIKTSASMPPAWAWITTFEIYWPAGQPVHSTAYCDCDWLNLSKSAFQPSFSPGWNCSQLITFSTLRSAPKARRPRSEAATRPPADRGRAFQDVAARRRQAVGPMRLRHRDPPRSEPALRRTTDCGAIDILINNAGSVIGSKSVLDFDPQQWRRLIDINLVSVFEVTKQVLPLMIQNGYGRIVNMASLAGMEGTPNLSAYSAAKAGVIALTKALGKELALTNIRVNCVAPGPIESDLLNQLSKEDLAVMLAKSPMKRPGTVDELARIVLFLTAEDNTLNTGAVFDASGGRAVY